MLQDIATAFISLPLLSSFLCSPWPCPHVLLCQPFYPLPSSLHQPLHLPLSCLCLLCSPWPCPHVLLCQPFFPLPYSLHRPLHLPLACQCLPTFSLHQPWPSLHSHLSFYLLLLTILFYVVRRIG